MTLLSAEVIAGSVSPSTLLFAWLVLWHPSIYCLLRYTLTAGTWTLMSTTQQTSTRLWTSERCLADRDGTCYVDIMLTSWYLLGDNGCTDDLAEILYLVTGDVVLSVTTR